MITPCSQLRPLVAVTVLAALASCTASNDIDVGSLKVSVATTGTNPDPNGYVVAIGQQPGEPIAVEGDVTISELRPGAYPARLSGLAPNCSIIGANPVTVEVAAGAQATLTFDVSCPGADTRVRITTATTGSDLDPDGYIVSIGQRTQRVPAQGVTRIALEETGQLPVTLTQASANCTPDPGNPATITTSPDTETLLSLLVNCAPTTGTVKVTVVTSGVDIQSDGFRVAVNQATKPLDASNTATFTGVPGGISSVWVDEDALHPNCRVLGRNPQYPIVEVSATIDVTFQVACVSTASITTHP